MIVYNGFNVNKERKNNMSKKHFIDFANEIAAMKNRKEAQASADMVISVALRHNGNFDTGRFLSACGL